MKRKLNVKIGVVSDPGGLVLIFRSCYPGFKKGIKTRISGIKTGIKMPSDCLKRPDFKGFQQLGNCCHGKP